MQTTPKANRLHIAIFGRRNTGKSSLINAIANQPIALVSGTPGTTTDPVYKAMELLPIGPVIWIDTAGIDDEGELGRLRVRRTEEVLEQTDVALLLFADDMDIAYEREWYRKLVSKDIPVIGLINKIDERYVDIEPLRMEFPIPFVKVSAKSKVNLERLKQMILARAPMGYERRSIIGDLVEPGGLAILVMPQNIQAPKGRLILPQVQVMRDLLDHHVCAVAVTEEELPSMLQSLTRDPDLVITDSQVFDVVNRIVPSHVRLTSFSILMARYKGDLDAFIEGARALERLRPGDSVLIAEACTHHPLQGDIGREKLPGWLERSAGGKLDITVAAGADFPEDLRSFKLVVHCGGCMLNRKQMLSRVEAAGRARVPITNYGLAIAAMNGMLGRVVGSIERQMH